ncbi:8-oxoguanine DNA-glycosylase [Oesophagostomum dentatum]|uniref:DNA-(apurinic or apyrimidinic site) lyase n=1 Tax=Oesophagostomum dentatum TaxID=61180 RepID=A0A0B1TFI6_OESDE|nr:8-oxoguanine DNA-glycosylase [Oesophagostomum dentatum]
MNVLRIPVSELNLQAVLLNGQWKNIKDAFYGVVEGLLLYVRRLDDERIEWSCLGRAARSASIDASVKLRDYFQTTSVQLDISLSDLWDDWCIDDPFMEQLRKVKELHGIRILKQEPLETLLAFICSSNNNITRISGMVNKLATLYGDPIVLDEPEQFSHILERLPVLGFSFPTLSKLAMVQNELTDVLREQNFGYRAKYISETVRQLSQMPPDILDKVQLLPCSEIRTFLRGFAGVGPKVAECVALMSLGQSQCVPIDRHVFEITKKFFVPTLKDSNLTDALNRRLMQFYEDKFGAYAGWAQAVLFNQQLQKYVSAPSIKSQIRSLQSVVKIEKKERKVVKKTRRKR